MGGTEITHSHVPTFSRLSEQVANPFAVESFKEIHNNRLLLFHNLHNNFKIINGNDIADFERSNNNDLIPNIVELRLWLQGRGTNSSLLFRNELIVLQTNRCVHSLTRTYLRNRLSTDFWVNRLEITFNTYFVQLQELFIKLEIFIILFGRIKYFRHMNSFSESPIAFLN